MDKISQNTSTAPPPALVRALLHALRPLIRLLLSYGVTYPYLANQLKTLYLNVATHEFQLPDKTQTASRLSLLTGLHRKDIKRLADNVVTTDNVAPAAISLGATLIARWSADPDYVDEQGQPLHLSRFATGSERVSFESLVTGVNKDIRPRPVLDEWLRLGIVQLDQNNRVRLNTAAFIPTQDLDEMAFYFGQNIHDHLAATAHNLLHDGPPFLERSVYYNNLTPESIAKLNELTRTLGTRALLAVNRQALELERLDQGKAEANQRMNFGIYFFSAPSAPHPTDTASVDENKKS
ncbi:MAG: DUF6502 family protein [Candidatus Nitrotoga sp.]